MQEQINVLQYTMPIPARYSHQRIALQTLQERDIYALIMEMGTGKSRPVIEDWIKRVEDGRAQDLVVLAPKGSYLNWLGTDKEPGEVRKWVPPHWLDKIFFAPWVSSANVAQKDAIAQLLRARCPRLLVMNIEALNSKGRARDYLIDFCRNRKVIGCIDESTTIAHEEAQRTQFILYTMAPRFCARRILTGLVAPETPLNVYSQYMFLDWQILGHRSFFSFRNRYAILLNQNFTSTMERLQGKRRRNVVKILGYRNQEELERKILAHSYRVTKDQVLDLPPKIYQFWDVELTKEQISAYVQMKNHAMARLIDGQFTSAKIILDQLGKLQHILCGHVRTEDGNVADIPEYRTDAVVEILQEHSGKAIIWCPWPQALRKIVRRLQDIFGEESTVGFWGETRLADRVEATSRIENDSKCRFIVSNQSVGGFGNTWVACNLVIYYANSFDNENRQQSEDRAHRIGQTKSVTYIDLRAKGTIDEKLIQILRKKMDLAAQIQGDKLKEWLI